MATDELAWTEPVTVVSAGRFELSPAEVESLPLRTARHTVVCSSGDRESGRWRGVRVAELVDQADPDAAATHLVVTGTDGYQVCVPLLDSLDALVAIDRLDAPADGSLPRFLGAAVGGTRSVKSVRRLETVELAAGEAATDHEQLQLTD